MKGSDTFSTALCTSATGKAFPSFRHKLYYVATLLPTCLRVIMSRTIPLLTTVCLRTSRRLFGSHANYAMRRPQMFSQTVQISFLKCIFPGLHCGRVKRVVASFFSISLSLNSICAAPSDKLNRSIIPLEPGSVSQHHSTNRRTGSIQNFRNERDLDIV